MKRNSQNGVALVITLIMLSVVTFMAITFLALSRRERGAVSVTVDQTTAKLMADAALADAESELMARIQSHTNQLLYDMFVSTNCLDTNTSLKLESPDAISRLRIRSRAPVYIATNVADARNLNLAPPPPEFRFYLDLNRNGRFESNGFFAAWDAQGKLVPALDANGQATSAYVSNYFVGDPEWIGMLERPQYPHSRTNRFIGRYAYLVIPSGKALDLNFIHNQAKNLGLNVDGFYRNQGVGSWELNLAAFLRDLNTNSWVTSDYRYNTNLGSGNNSLGWAFLDAKDLLRTRYNNNYNTLNNVFSYLGTPGEHTFQLDLIDEYAAAPLYFRGVSLPLDTDLTLGLTRNRPWAGSDNPNQYTDVQELFNTGNAYLTRRLQGTYNPVTTNSSYDRYTFYRLMAQLGVDSAPANDGKININYQNRPFSLLSATNFVDWTPEGFFTNAAAKLLQTQLDFGNLRLVLTTTNTPIFIPIYPVNYYSAAVHRMLQLAANIYDATTNHYYGTAAVGPAFPSVFRPLFGVTNINVSGVLTRTIYISGYEPAPFTTNVLGTTVWHDLSNPNDRNVRPHDMIYGIPLVVGAKKGYPNFNEFAMQTAVQISRKIQMSKSARSAHPNATNQMYILGISNSFGVEAWNSYTQQFPRALDLRVVHRYSVTLSNYGNLNPLPLSVPRTGTIVSNTSLALNSWEGQGFRIPLQTNLVFLNDAAFISYPTPHFIPFNTNPVANLVFEATPGFPVPQWGLAISNQLQYLMTDHQTGRIVDFVNLDGLNTYFDLTRDLIGNTTATGASSAEASFWQTNRSIGAVPDGVFRQIMESLGQSSNSSSIWVDSNQNPITGAARDKAVDLFRVFVGLTPFKYPTAQMQQELGNSLTHQLPFTPSRKIYQNISWQANDPLVHSTIEDLTDLERTNNVQFAIPLSAMPTNSNLGKLNRRYRPWGGSPMISSDSDTNAFNLGLKDSLVARSDDWNFPSNKFANIGWLGRVHRGSPWQTVYMKAPVVNTNSWRMWAFNYLTHPTNDWRLFDVFTAAPNDNAARGLLGVNQTNQAAWSAVLSGVCVISNSPTTVKNTALTSLGYVPWIIQPASPQLRQIVDNLNLVRSQMPDQVFHHAGEIMAAPALTTASPFLDLRSQNSLYLPDEVYERIPQQIMSLVKPDEPRVVIYAFGQSLSPAGAPMVAPGTSSHLMYTNYYITGEIVSKHILQIQRAPLIKDNPIITSDRFQYSTVE